MELLQLVHNRLRDGTRRHMRLRRLQVLPPKLCKAHGSDRQALRRALINAQA